MFFIILETPEIIVQGMATKQEGNKRTWDKKHSGVFCGVPQAKISRHYQRVHKEERSVLNSMSPSQSQCLSPEPSSDGDQVRINDDHKVCEIYSVKLILIVNSYINEDNNT